MALATAPNPSRRAPMQPPLDVPIAEEGIDISQEALYRASEALKLFAMEDGSLSVATSEEIRRLAEHLLKLSREN